MTEYQKHLFPPLGVYASPTFAYDKICISNHNYAKYSKSSLTSNLDSHLSKIRSADSTGPHLNHSHTYNGASGTKNRSSSLAIETTPQDVAHLETDMEDKLNQIADDSANPARALSKKYQKYRSLLLSKKSSTTSLSRQIKTGSPPSNVSATSTVTFSSLPDEIVQIILGYVISEVSYFKRPYNSKAFTASLASSISSVSADYTKRSYSVSFNLTPIYDNKTSLLDVNPDHQLRIKRPKDVAGYRQHQRYLDQVLRNYKLSKHYRLYPNREAVMLLYVCKRIYRLALPLVYRKIKFLSSYRFAQFITTIRSNNKLGLLVEDVWLHDIDTLYYITFENSEVGESNTSRNGNNDTKSFMILTEREKNKIEQLMNNSTLYFDGTFNNIDMNKIPSNRINLTEVANSPGKLPICIVKDEHSVASNNNFPLFFDFEDYDFGFKEKIVLAGWREWKFRYDPLYNTIVPTAGWVKQQKSKAIQKQLVKRSTSYGTLAAEVVTNASSAGRSNSPVARISSRNSVASSLHSESLLSRYASLESAGSSLRTKFRKIVYKMGHRKKRAVKGHSRRNQKLVSSKSVAISAANGKLKPSVSESTTTSKKKALLFNQHPMKSKLLYKYSTKDIPIGYIIHLLNVCTNLRLFDMSKVILAGDYEIKANAVDDYGILQDRKPDARRASFDVNQLERPNIHSRTFSDNAGITSNSRSTSGLGYNKTLHKKSKSITDFKNISSSKALGDYYQNISSRSMLFAEGDVGDGSFVSSKANRAVKQSLESHPQPKDSNYSSILKEIDSAYGVSIYSQFNSVVHKKPDVKSVTPQSLTKTHVVAPSYHHTTNAHDGFDFTLGDKNTHNKKATRPLEFYKDSFGYSNNCNYKQIQSNFYKDFWGYSNFNNKFGNNDKSKDLVLIDTSEPEEMRPKSPAGFGLAINSSDQSFGKLSKDDVRSQESFLLVNNSKLSKPSSRLTLNADHATYSIGSLDNSGASTPVSGSSQSFLPLGKSLVKQTQLSSVLKSKLEASSGVVKKVSFNQPQINIIEELKDEEEDAKAKLNNNKSKATDNDTALFTKSPTLSYFLFSHEPAKLTSDNQFDYVLYLSDVRKVNHWSLDQLRKVSNEEILYSLAMLRNLEYVSLRSVNWINTKDVKSFVQSSSSIKHRKLKKVDFRNSGMRRDLQWAIEGSVRDLRRALKEMDLSNESTTATLNIGRNYSRF